VNADIVTDNRVQAAFAETKLLPHFWVTLEAISRLRFQLSQAVRFRSSFWISSAMIVELCWSDGHRSRLANAREAAARLTRFQ
jgi:hypothetical protein